MRVWSLVFVAPSVATVAIGIAAATSIEPVPLFTSEDLDRMFGPAPEGPSEAVDKTRPEDWRWVQEFLDRQYSRIDADRRFELDRRSVDISEGVIERSSPYHGHSVAWSLGYPASTWWNTVWSRYAPATGGVACHSGDGGLLRASGKPHQPGHRGGPGRGRGVLHTRR